MQRNARLMVLTILALFMLPLVVNAEPQVQEEFVISADGDESTDSIYDFNETLPDDVMFYPDGSDFSTSDHYAESFADVSDWLIMDDEGNDTFSSDGDLLHFESKTDSEDDGESVYSNVPSLVGQYLEIRYRLNTTSLAIFAVGTYSSDGGLAGNINWFGMTITTSWTTSKFPINSDTVIESVRLYIYHVTGQPPVDLQVDYLRIGPAAEMGWQHDGSTTAGVTDDGQTDVVYTTTTDGDVLTLNATNTGAHVGYVRFYISFDTTTTAAELEMDYYQFVEVKYRLKNKDASAFHFRSSYDVKYHSEIIPAIFNEWITVRWNHVAGAGSSSDGTIWIDGYLQAAESYEYEIDWFKVYSIANFTVTQHASVTTAEVVYVNDDNALVFDKATSNYITISYNPALTINTATYNVWNITTPDINSRGDAGYTNNFQTYVGDWESHFDESRGTYSSGTLTSFQIVNYGDTTISAIKFIEDGTAPVISDFWIVPYTPTEEDNVTLAIYETDAGVGTYTVIFNAVDYPAGFVDVDMDAVESLNKDGLWSYTIDSSDLPAGYYVFEVIASDGANEGTELTIFEVIDVTDNIFYLLFLSTEMWGYLGPMGLVIVGYYLSNKDKFLGVLWFVVECLFMSQYFLLVAATPDYWWHIIILLFGGLLTCVYPLWDR